MNLRVDHQAAPIPANPMNDQRQRGGDHEHQRRTSRDARESARTPVRSRMPPTSDSTAVMPSPPPSANINPCGERVAAVRLEDRHPQHLAVAGDEGQEDAELPIERRTRLLHEQLDDLHDRRDRDDERDHAQERRGARARSCSAPTPRGSPAPSRTSSRARAASPSRSCSSRRSPGRARGSRRGRSS